MTTQRVADWMTSGPITIATGTNLAAARARMERDEIRRLLVIDDSGRLAGIVTWGDVAEAWPSDFTPFEPFEVRELMARVRVDEIMTSPVLTIDADATIAEAANLMFERRIGAVPVLDGGQLVGIMSSSDVLQGLVRVLSERD